MAMSPRNKVVLGVVGLLLVWSAILGVRLMFIGGVFTPPLRGDGRNLASYGFDLSTSLVPIDQILPAGFARDKIKALNDPQSPSVEVALKLKVGHGPLLKPGVRVIGVELNGQARAYPVLITQLHEVINDTLGGVPIAVTFSPLTDSAVVFDRRVGDRVLSFGVSGLVYNSNTLLFDRNEQPADESLWSQLGMRAVAGKAAAAGQTLSTIPMRLVTLDHWLARHPDTTLSVGLYDVETDMRSRYIGNPYSMYFSNGQIPFPVEPRVSDEPMDGLTAFDKVVARRAPDGQWHFARHAIGDDLEQPIDAHALWFAWFAMHPDAVMDPSVAPTLPSSTERPAATP